MAIKAHNNPTTMAFEKLMSGLSNPRSSNFCSYKTELVIQLLLEGVPGVKLSFAAAFRCRFVAQGHLAEAVEAPKIDRMRA